MWLNRRNTFTGRLYRCVRASQAGTQVVKMPCRLSQACMALGGSSPAMLPEHETPSSMAMMPMGMQLCCCMKRPLPCAARACRYAHC